ncbi:MAG: type II toxin-antitoxin system prevent-host-death family antitoxin, partial [Actinobacteria bacterium]|nr:type II toxin-antitoxin system prevent-host-death family antitoxin [Actinomycetota bacterium]
MERIGIRELRQHASRCVRRAAGGETFEITDRGRPVALLVPPRRAGDGIERLRAEGRTRRATRDLLDLGPPFPAEPGVPLPSELLAEMREHRAPPRRGGARPTRGARAGRPGRP